MKSTGIVRKVDELGRVVIPKELRKTLEIREGDPLEILVDGEHIILRKHISRQACILTGHISEDNLTLHDGQIVLSPEGANQMLKELKKHLDE
ncbi:AbrB/MazE/SpoVT family DNA-binding domain-containing protein [Caldalkalibacillus salinus]|uniref:AbrB/MazE/SpoVT family DNA-binding domain-containing protein n=1 Tax=Caldalkalibacillus salinus TaxID=2803787 RepID=UPI001921200F|nr:AbrB/MazE/SpoVT family DNA-binding domain-containing protein [Caldalkalibacillus salinus]